MYTAMALDDKVLWDAVYEVAAFQTGFKDSPGREDVGRFRDKLWH